MKKSVKQNKSNKNKDSIVGNSTSYDSYDNSSEEQIRAPDATVRERLYPSSYPIIHYPSKPLDLRTDDEKEEDDYQNTLVSTANDLDYEEDERRFMEEQIEAILRKEEEDAEERTRQDIFKREEDDRRLLEEKSAQIKEKRRLLIHAFLIRVQKLGLSPQTATISAVLVPILQDYLDCKIDFHVLDKDLFELVQTYLDEIYRVPVSKGKRSAISKETAEELDRILLSVMTCGL